MPEHIQVTQSLLWSRWGSSSLGRRIGRSLLIAAACPREDDDHRYCRHDSGDDDAGIPATGTIDSRGTCFLISRGI